MGFRSEIYIQLDKNIEDKFVDLIAEHSLSEEFEKIEENGETVKYVGTWLKWYPSYEDVKAINTFIDDNYESCGLLGIGEDGAESAREGNVDEFDMYIVSTINW